MENNSLPSHHDLNCPVYSEADQRLLAFFSFWIEGVLTTLVAILGIMGNTVVSFIISNKEMKNSFNLLLVSLACFDSTYVSDISFKKIFKCYVPVATVSEPRGSCNLNCRLEVGHFQIGHFEKPRFPCSELLRLD